MDVNTEYNYNHKLTLLKYLLKSLISNTNLDKTSNVMNKNKVE